MVLTQQCHGLDDASGRSPATGELFLYQPSLSALHQCENDDRRARSFSRWVDSAKETVKLRVKLVERGLLPYSHVV